MERRRTVRFGTGEPGGTDLVRRVGQFEADHADLLLPCRVDPIADGFHVTVDVHHCGPLIVADAAGAACRMESLPAEAGALQGAVAVSLLIRGEGRLDYDGTAHAVGAGAIAVLPVERLFACASDSAFLCRSILISGKVLDGLSLSDAARRFSGLVEAGTPEARLLTGYAAAVTADILDADPALADIAGEHLLDLVVAMIAGAAGIDDPTGGRGARELRMQRAYGIVGSEFADPALTEWRLGLRLGVDPDYVGRMFERAGTTFSDHLSETRLQYVRGRVAAATVPQGGVEDLARAAGFSDGASLIRAYRRRFGESPALSGVAKGGPRRPGGGDRSGQNWSI